MTVMGTNVNVKANTNVSSIIFLRILPPRESVSSVRSACFHRRLHTSTPEVRFFQFLLMHLNAFGRREGWPGCRLERRLRTTEDERRRYGGSQYERAEAGGAHGRRPRRRHRAG